MISLIYTKIEDLANELWLNIFAYLNICDQFKAFRDLNKRLDQLLFLNQRYISCKNDDKDTQHLIKHVLPYITNREHVSGLRLENTKRIDFDYYAKLFYFPCLNTLRLHRLNITKELMHVIQQNSKHIRYLYMSQVVSYNKISKKELLKTILSLPNLQTCRLRLGLAMCSSKFNISSTSSANDVRLIGIYENCTVDQLMKFLQYLPCLQSLHIIANDLDFNPTKMINNLKCTVPVSTFTLNVKTLKLPFVQLKNFIICALPYVNKLHIICRTPLLNLNYLDIQEWIGFVQTLSNLEQVIFDVHCNDIIDDKLWNKTCKILIKIMNLNHVSLRIGK